MHQYLKKKIWKDIYQFFKRLRHFFYQIQNNVAQLPGTKLPK